MIEKSVHPGFTEPSELLAKVHKLPHRGEWVTVRALLRRRRTQDVGYHGRVAHFLVGHELNQKPVLGIQPGRFKIFDGECGETVMEQIQFDPLLI